MIVNDNNCEYPYLNFFGNVESVGPVYLGKILDYFKTPKNAYDHINEVQGQLIPENVLNDIVIRKKNFDLLGEYEKLVKEDIGICTYGNPDYPYLLKQLYAPPPFFYYRGNLKPLNNQIGIGVVGSRKISNYGKAVLEYITPDLVKNNLTIISGLALGTDGYAHKVCLDNQGYTAGVLGCGLDSHTIYPATNLNLAKRILDSGGALISEYPIKSPSIKFHFPVRNRLISGLSRGVLVVEAATKSGSLITAHCALEQNRDVFAVPGPIFSEVSQGTNSLLGKGAISVQNAQDILNHYKITPKKYDNLSSLSEDELAVFKSISDGNNTLDDLLIKLKINISTLSILLMSMTSKGVVKRVDDIHYSIVKS